MAKLIKCKTCNAEIASNAKTCPQCGAKNQKPFYKKWWFWGITIFVIIMIIAINSGDSESSDKSSNNGDVSKTEKSSNSKKEIGVGQVLKTDYFDIVVNRVSFENSVRTGNEFADLAPEQGIVYLIFNVSFKNTDTESRMLSEGSVWINYNNKDYEFDKSEGVFIDGWGLLLDQINPLVTKTTNLVYKIPSEIKGSVYWKPGRSSKNQRIFLGNL